MRRPPRPAARAAAAACCADASVAARAASSTSAARSSVATLSFSASASMARSRSTSLDASVSRAWRCVSNRSASSTDAASRAFVALVVACARRRRAGFVGRPRGTARRAPAVRVQGLSCGGELVARAAAAVWASSRRLCASASSMAHFCRQGRVDRALRERDVVRILPLGLGAFPLRVGLAQGRQGLLVPGVGEQRALVGRGPNLRRRGLEPPALGERRASRAAVAAAAAARPHSASSHWRHRRPGSVSPRRFLRREGREGRRRHARRGCRDGRGGRSDGLGAPRAPCATADASPAAAARAAAPASARCLRERAAFCSRASNDAARASEARAASPPGARGALLRRDARRLGLAPPAGVVFLGQGRLVRDRRRPRRGVGRPRRLVQRVARARARRRRSPPSGFASARSWRALTSSRRRRSFSKAATCSATTALRARRRRTRDAQLRAAPPVVDAAPQRIP